MSESALLLENTSRRASGVRSLWPAPGFLPDPSLTFPAVFAQRLAQDRAGIAFSEAMLDDREIRPNPHSFPRIHARARSAAEDLVRAGVGPGDRVLLCIGNAASFLSFFLGVQSIGAVPVPLPCPSEFRVRGTFRERIDTVASDCAPQAIVVDTVRDIESLSDLATSAVRLDASAADRLPDPNAPLESFCLDRSFREIAFIQYTSGSTGSPKGVVVTHGNLVANMRAIAEGGQFGPNDRSFSWLPLYHDMGLVGGILIGIYLGLPTFVMPTRTFVGKPDAWLRAMSQFRATFACAPNFAYSMLARRLPDRALAGLDLSHWRLAVNGAEPIDRATLEDFVRRLAPARLSPRAMFPVYGMAECTLAVAFPEPGAPPRYDVVDRETLSRECRAEPATEAGERSLCFVSVGRAVPSHHVRIVDPDGEEERPERHIGEVVVSGPSVTPYYFKKDGLHPPQRTELRTGDLGYVADGELYLVDRVKDLIIVGGRNIVPSDVERAVARVPGIRYGSVVAFAQRGEEGTDELYVVAGVEPKALNDAQVRMAVRGAVYGHFAVTPKDVLFVKPSMIPKTSSGKIRRAACREIYERGGFAIDVSQEESLP